MTRYIQRLKTCNLKDVADSQAILRLVHRLAKRGMGQELIQKVMKVTQKNFDPLLQYLITGWNVLV